MALAALEPHPHAAAVLGAAVDGTPSHAYLLHGPAGSGKRAAARALAAELHARGAGDPAGARLRVQHRRCRLIKRTPGREIGVSR